MPSVNGTPVLPGVYTQVQTQLLPSVTGGIRVACFIGSGRLTNLVVGESVVREAADITANPIIPFTVTTVTDGTHLVVSSTVGMTAGDTIKEGSFSTTITTVTDGTHLVVGSTVGFVATGSGNNDALLNTATVLDGTTITDQNFATYRSGADYSATPVSGGIGWLTGAAQITGTTSAPYADQNGNTFSFKVGSNPITVVTFSGVTTSVASVVSQINTAYGDTIASANGAHLELSTGTLTVPVLFNTSITIENGTSNSALGFTAGSLVSAPSRPANGITYFANYEWAKFVGDGQGSFTPKFYFLQNFSTVTNDYGAVGGGNDGQLANMNNAWTLPIAAQLAQQNGASIVCLMQLNPAGGTAVASQVRSALTQLFIPNIDIVVSLAGSANSMLIPDITNHVTEASSTINRLERTAFIGFAANDPSFTNQSTMLGYATAASSNRVVVVNQTNTTYTMFIGTNTLPSTVDGTMMAAALAAVRTNPAFTVSQPLTREVLSGIAITTTLAQASKVILSNNGVLVVDNISGSAKVIFGTTTDFADILDQLYQVVEIADYCTQTIRGLLDPIFIGQKLLANTPSQVETVTSAILSDIESSNIIESFTQPTATVNPLQPTQILVQVGVQPVLELDTIFITLGLNLV
jgi:hypothetical protein